MPSSFESQRIIAGNELSDLQQIQGGQQIDEETSAIHGSRIARITMGNQLANRQLTYVGVLRRVHGLSRFETNPKSG